MRVRIGVLVVLSAIVGCSGDSSTNPPTGTYTVGGNVAGLEGGGLVLSNGSDTVAPQGNGSFAFPTAMATGQSYDVAVATQPTNPAQVCTVQNGTGTVGSTNVSGVSVTCS